MLKELQNLGFKQNEAKIYLALLKIGSCSTAPLIKETNLHRSIVYESLDQLISRGLVSSIIKERKKHFKALSPEKMIKQEKERLFQIQNLVPALVSLQKKEKQEIIIYEGQKGFQDAHIDAVKQMGNKTYIYVMIAGGKRWTKNMGKVQDEFNRIRKKKNIKNKVILLEHQREIGKEQAKRGLFEAKYLPESYDSPTGISIYGNMTLMLFYDEPIYAILIKNKRVSRSFKNHFEIIWKLAKK